ncbi:hypothetical protein Xinn_02350 [Xenorhabdus innexi]|uniref:Uncharacterized protein n=1 Tax=Xenorhabdus innexi TaxID=290109 RepID=A0A2G0NFP7_9GAMM|nr:hypothetical protein Xinn_02350 [Xenorhabdus innexi]
MGNIEKYTPANEIHNGYFFLVKIQGRFINENMNKVKP